MTERYSDAKPERIEPGVYKPVIDTILYIDKVLCGQFIIRSGAQTVYFRDVVLSKDKTKNFVYGMHENLGPVRTSFRSDLTVYKDIVEAEQTVPETEVSQFYLAMKKVDIKVWINSYKRAREKAEKRASEIKKSEPVKRPPLVPQEIIREITKSLRHTTS